MIMPPYSYFYNDNEFLASWLIYNTKSAVVIAKMLNVTNLSKLSKDLSMSPDEINLHLKIIGSLVPSLVKLGLFP